MDYKITYYIGYEDCIGWEEVNKECYEANKKILMDLPLPEGDDWHRLVATEYRKSKKYFLGGAEAYHKDWFDFLVQISMPEDDDDEEEVPVIIAKHSKKKRGK